MANLFSGVPKPSRFDAPLEHTNDNAARIAAMENVRDREMRRRLEVDRAITLGQLDKVAGFKLSDLPAELGQQFMQEVNAIIPLIKEGGDLEEIEGAISGLRVQFEQDKAQKTSAASARAAAELIANGDAQAIETFNMGLGAGERVVRPNLAAMDQDSDSYFLEGSSRINEQGVMVGIDKHNPTGGEVSIRETTQYANSSMSYIMDIEKGTTMTAREYAQHKATQNRMTTESPDEHNRTVSDKEFVSWDKIGSAKGRDFRAAMVASYEETNGSFFHDEAARMAFINGGEDVPALDAMKKHFFELSKYEKEEDKTPKPTAFERNLAAKRETFRSGMDYYTYGEEDSWVRVPIEGMSKGVQLEFEDASGDIDSVVAVVTQIRLSENGEDIEVESFDPKDNQSNDMITIKMNSATARNIENALADYLGLEGFELEALLHPEFIESITKRVDEATPPVAEEVVDDRNWLQKWWNPRPSDGADFDPNKY